ncbi:hypothetical protein M899_0663 [Bacteriovorax sp. BSW11_IV]|uniref:hypothetical protein n=1 Tax=Bacteriovorax sp. BSW11_IV TaxID=1353529 RepID=UPI00038A5464|nr:hypothetical protein [Bacteriovorax sp. BSW11_IV]EQC49018.1 hypothetical protein M899_0663 [Bacteriovorax sp. BSW11_IV]
MKAIVLILMMSFFGHAMASDITVLEGSEKNIELIKRRIRIHEAQIQGRENQIEDLKDILFDAKRDAYIASTLGTTGIAASLGIGLGAISMGAMGGSTIINSLTSSVVVSDLSVIANLGAIFAVPATGITLAIKETSNSQELTEEDEYQLKALYSLSELAKKHKEIDENFRAENDSKWHKLKDMLTFGWHDVNYVENTIKLAHAHIILHNAEAAILSELENHLETQK